jgi:hypothetical protein
MYETEEVVTKQRIKIVGKSFIVTKYHCSTYTCSHRETTHRVPDPEGSCGGLFSVELIALAAYLKGRCHVSFKLDDARFEVPDCFRLLLNQFCLFFD